MRNAFLLTVAMIVTGWSAYAQHPPLAPCDAPTFVSSVKVLSAGFNPTANPYVPPSGQAAPSAPTQQDLANAFTNAPPLVRSHLCALNGIFINPSGSSSIFNNSWGFRSRNAQDRGNTYVAVSMGLWPAQNSAIPLHQYENLMLLNFALWPKGPSINSAAPDYSWLTVQAALAHELGHVRWALTNIRQPGDPHNFNTLRNCSLGNGTAVNFFAAWNYLRDKQLESPGRWRHFGERTNGENGEIDHRFPPYLSDLQGANPNQALYQLYRRDQPPANQPWPSLFGAQTPEEEFVETYVLYALLGNKFDNPAYSGSYLASLPLTIPGYTDPGHPGQWADIPRDLLSGNKAILAQNMQCLKSLP